MIKNSILAILIILTGASFVKKHSLKGTWQYAGGIYNGKPEGPTSDYQLQREYHDDTTFDAYLLEAGEKPVKYQSGNYKLDADSCFETETFNIQSARLTGLTIHYHYTIQNDSLILSGTLPTGMVVEEYWKKIK